MADNPFTNALETLKREVRSTQDLQSTISYLIGITYSTKSTVNYITLEVTNPEFLSRVWRYSGAMKLLEEAGWIEEPNRFLMFINTKESNMKNDLLSSFLIRNRMAVLPSPHDPAYIERFTALKLDGRLPNLDIQTKDHDNLGTRTFPPSNHFFNPCNK